MNKRWTCNHCGISGWSQDGMIPSHDNMNGKSCRKSDQKSERELRKMLDYGYKLINGKTMSRQAVDSYNRLQERINSFISAGLPVPEHLLNGSFNLINSHLTEQSEKIVKPSENYYSAIDRINRADSLEACRKLDIALTRLYEVGAFTPREYSRLDGKLVNKMIELENEES